MQRQISGLSRVHPESYRMAAEKYAAALARALDPTITQETREARCAAVAAALVEMNREGYRVNRNELNGEVFKKPVRLTS